MTVGDFIDRYGSRETSDRIFGHYLDKLHERLLRAMIKRLIREAKRYKADLPVIIITGYSTESAAIEAVNLGVSGYLTKPFRVPQVLAAAAKALGETS